MRAGLLALVARLPPWLFVNSQLATSLLVVVIVVAAALALGERFGPGAAIALPLAVTLGLFWTGAYVAHSEGICGESCRCDREDDEGEPIVRELLGGRGIPWEEDDPITDAERAAVEALERRGRLASHDRYYGLTRLRLAIHAHMCSHPQAPCAECLFLVTIWEETTLLPKERAVILELAARGQLLRGFPLDSPIPPLLLDRRILANLIDCDHLSGAWICDACVERVVGVGGGGPADASRLEPGDAGPGDVGPVARC